MIVPCLRFHRLFRKVAHFIKQMLNLNIGWTDCTVRPLIKLNATVTSRLPVGTAIILVS
jgi:hypothetical protein